jgi:ATP-binding cassette subfamily B (MDR/TAP) protein 1
MVNEELFEHQFELAMDKALSMGLHGTFVEGFTLGVASGLIYATEALLFYVGAVLIARGTYTDLRLLWMVTHYHI